MPTAEGPNEKVRKNLDSTLWMAVPIELEDYIVDFAAKNMRAEDVNDSVCGELSELAATCTL